MVKRRWTTHEYRGRIEDDCRQQGWLRLAEDSVRRKRRETSDSRLAHWICAAAALATCRRMADDITHSEALGASSVPRSRACTRAFSPSDSLLLLQRLLMHYSLIVTAGDPTHSLSAYSSASWAPTAGPHHFCSDQ